MSTTTEIEDRLRRTAQACEPIVDELLRDAMPGAAATTAPQPRRAGWLVAAAVFVVVALGVGALVATRNSEPANEVAAEPEVSDVGGAVAAPPGEGLLLPDGSRVQVVVPGPSTWEPDASASVTIDLDSLPDPSSVTFRAGAIADLVSEGFTIEQDLGEGRAIVREGNLTSVAVAHDGWVGLMQVATAYDGDEDLSAAAIATLGTGLAFDVSPEGPVAVRGPGVTVTGSSRGLRPTDGGDGRIGVSRAGGNALGNCPQTPPPWRCFADDTILVMVDGDIEAAEALVGGIRVDGVQGEEIPPATEARTIAVPTREQIDLELPAGLGWEVLQVSVRARMAGDDVLHTVTVTPAAPAPARGPEVVDEDGSTVLLLERDGWRVTLPLATAGVDLITRDRWEPLRASMAMEVSDDVEMWGVGVSELVADGLTLVDATIELGPDDGSDDRLRVRVDGTDPPPCTPAADTRCLMEGAAVAVGVGPVGLEVLSEVRVQGMGSHS